MKIFGWKFDGCYDIDFIDEESCPICGEQWEEIGSCSRCEEVEILKHLYDPYGEHHEMRDMVNKTGAVVEVSTYYRIDRDSRDAHIKFVYFGFPVRGNVLDCIEENKDKLAPFIPQFGKPDVFSVRDTYIDDTNTEHGAENYGDDDD